MGGHVIPEGTALDLFMLNQRNIPKLWLDVFSVKSSAGGEVVALQSFFGHALIQRHRYDTPAMFPSYRSSFVACMTRFVLLVLVDTLLPRIMYVI